MRQLTELRMLTLAGNEVCKEHEYKTTALAYLKFLKYFDYMLVGAVEVAEARETFIESLEVLEENETVLQDKRDLDRKAQEDLKHLEDAGIFFASALFDDMFALDNEIARLKALPNVTEIVNDFRDDFKAESAAFIKDANAVYTARLEEVALFEKAFKAVRVRDDKISASLVEKFAHSLKTELAALHEASPTLRMAAVERLSKALEALCDELMSIEVRQVEKFESLLDEFENKLNELKARSLDLQQQFFRKVEDSEEKFTRAVKETVSELIDKNSNGELAADFLDDEATNLVLDKDMCLTLITTSHELHMGKIMKKEDEARMTETKTYQEEVARYVRDERKRNRDRVLQIFDFGRQNRAVLDAKLSTDDDDAFDEEPNM